MYPKKILTVLKNPQIRISYNNTFSKLNHIYILKITIKKFGDYPLISYEPIALTRSKNVVENGVVLTRSII